MSLLFDGEIAQLLLSRAAGGKPVPRRLKEHTDTTTRQVLTVNAGRTVTV